MVNINTVLYCSSVVERASGASNILFPRANAKNFSLCVCVISNDQKLGSSSIKFVTHIIGRKISSEFLGKWANGSNLFKMDAI